MKTQTNHRRHNRNIIEHLAPSDFSYITMRETGERRTFRKARFAVFAVILFLGAVGLVLFWLWYSSRPITFPNGLSLRLAAVTMGTNEFVEGWPLEKILGNRIPAKGFEFAGITLQRPRHYPSSSDAPLTAWILMKSPSISPQDFKYYWEGSQVIAANRNGRKIENPPVRPYRISTNEVLMFVPLYAFPRDQRAVQLRIIPPQDYGGESAMAQFEFRNPLRTRPQHWNPSPPPATNEIDGLKIVLLDAHIDPAQMEFRLSSVDCHFTSGRITDEEGNTFSWSSLQGLAQDRFLMGFQYGLERGRTWRIDARFIRAVQLPMTEASLFPDDGRKTVQLSLNKPDILLTNSVGETFSCGLSGKQIIIRSEHGKDRPYWVVLEATDESNQPIPFDGGAAWEGTANRPKVQKWWLERSATNVTLKVASAKAFNTHFYITPR